MSDNKNTKGASSPALGALRMTKQRAAVFEVLQESGSDHPTANEVFMRVRERVPNVSLATVYNCLEALADNHLVTQVNFDREPSRFCPNLCDHGHFHDVETGSIHDVLLKDGLSITDVLDLPEGAVIEDFEITLRGKMPNNS